MRTLLYHFGALGDFITTLPAVACWRKLFPGPVTLLGKPAIGNLAQSAGYCDHVIDADSSRYLFLFTEQTDAEQIRAFYRSFDALLLFADDRSGIAINAARHFPGKLFCQPPLPSGNLHAVDYHLSLCPRTLPDPLQRLPVLKPAGPATPKPPTVSADTTRPVIAIHPGSGSRLKNWPLERFISAAAALTDRGYAVAWITGPAEPSVPIPGNNRHLGNCTLTDCALFLQQCSGYLGNDSGITHLAAAAGCRVVALFGPSDPARWAPRGTGTITVIHHPPPSCAPCHLQPRENVNCTRECLMQITVEEVVAAFVR